MNEQIRELVKQAGGISYDDDGNQLPIMLVGKSAVEKFAELILQECKLFCGHDSEGVSAMFKHFGVEE